LNKHIEAYSTGLAHGLAIAHDGETFTKHYTEGFYKLIHMFSPDMNEESTIYLGRNGRTERSCSRRGGYRRSDRYPTTTNHQSSGTRYEMHDPTVQHAHIGTVRPDLRDASVGSARRCRTTEDVRESRSRRVVPHHDETDDVEPLNNLYPREETDVQSLNDRIRDPPKLNSGY
jgi:hypothetical protein